MAAKTSFVTLRNKANFTKRCVTDNLDNYKKEGEKSLTV